MVGGGIVAAVVSPGLLPKIGIILVFLLVFGLMAFGVWVLWRSRTRKKRGKGIAEAVGGEFDKQAAGSNDHEQKARLEEMKRKFMLLINRLRTEGNQDIYEMPWFLTMGPSGTGKSWVLKGSGLEPLEDVEWKGGTFLIDWWTCAEALVLDTAGGVVFGEERYDSPEWMSLLKLLKQHRPQCPINGVLVVVPAQLLWLKPSELPAGWLSLEEYADRLRTQIRGRLQRAIGVRFPVYFLVTQSDRIPGFREFADALDAEGKPKSQMLGWSNPLRVGEDGGKFKSGADPKRTPEYTQVQALAEHLAEVADDVRRQRLTLLESYVGKGAQPDENGMGVRKRAADLFSFADAIQTALAPRLQELLLAVFKPDGLLPRPPYLRGVYFTSAMREGEVLDRQLARVVGKPLSVLALPGSVDKKQPNPFFLKDLIFKKAFVEAWLVTPLEDARTYLRHRRRALYIGGIGAAAVLLLAIAIGGWSYYENVGKELKGWKDVAQSVERGSWLPVVVKSDGGGHVLGKDESGERLNLTTHDILAREARGGLGSSSFWRLGWLFNSSKLDRPRRAAQLKLFEQGVIGPMAESAQRELKEGGSFTNDPTRLADEISRFQGALLAVLELELATNRVWKDDELGKSRDRVLRGLIEYLLPKSGAAETPVSAQRSALISLTTTFDNTYADSVRRKQWPPTRTKRPLALTNFLTAAFAQLANLHEAQSQVLLADRQKTIDLLTNAQSKLKLERALVAGMHDRKPVTNLSTDLQGLQKSWNDLSQRLEEGGILYFSNAFTNFQTLVDREAAGRKESLKKQLLQVNGASSGTNLTGVVSDAFTALSERTPGSYKQLRDFSPDLWRDATLVDGDLLTQAAGRSQRGFLPDPPTRVFAHRLVVYAHSLQPPSIALNPETFFGNRNTAAQGIQGVRSEAVKKAIESIGRDPLLKEMSITPRQSEADSNVYSEVITSYLEFRHVEHVLGEARNKLSRDIESYTLASVGGAKPADVMQLFVTYLKNLHEWELIWVDLSNAWLSVRGPIEQPGQLSRGLTNDILSATKAIGEKRTSLVKEIANRFERDLEGYKKFPLEFEVNGESLSSKNVIDAWKIAGEWKSALKEASKELVSSPKIDYLKPLRETEFSWDRKFDKLIDEKGTLRNYRVTTPWSAVNNPIWENLIQNGGSKVKNANSDPGKYRSWWFGEGRNLRADDPKSKLEVRCDLGFELQGYQIGTSNPAEFKPQGQKPRIGGWTIIDLIRNGIEKSPRYFVPIEVGGGMGEVTAWFVIEPIGAADQP